MTKHGSLGLLAAGAAAVGLAACAWVFGGNAYAARRERAAAVTLEKTFGPRTALAARYAAADTNAEARRAEELAKAVGYELTPKPRGARDTNGAGKFSDFSEKERSAIGDYVTAQLVRADDSVSPPSPELAAILAKHRGPLTTFEEILSSAPSPRWAFHPTASGEDVSTLNFVGHMQMQRLLAADALAAASRGDSATAAMVLEASWRLNEALVARPKSMSHLIAIAVARTEAGTLRKVPAAPDAWGPRLAAMGLRAPLVDALVLEHGDPGEFVQRMRAGLAREDDGGGNRFVNWLREPAERVFGAEYSEGWGREIARLRDAPAFEVPKVESRNPRWPTEVILAIAIPTLRNSFERADRLALDAELTGKILRMKETRRTRGAWPEPSPEFASSRFPGLSWRYRPAGEAASITLGQDLPNPFPKNSLVLPLSFTAAAPAP